MYVFFVYRFYSLDHDSTYYVSACDSVCLVIAVSIFRVSSCNRGRSRQRLDTGLVDEAIAYCQVSVKF